MLATRLPPRSQVNAVDDTDNDDVTLEGNLELASTSNHFWGDRTGCMTARVPRFDSRRCVSWYTVGASVPAALVEGKLLSTMWASAGNLLRIDARKSRVCYFGTVEGLITATIYFCPADYHSFCSRLN